MNVKLLLAVLGSTLAIIVLASVLLSKTANQPAPTFDIQITDTDHITGNASASATLVEYSDFQCPACAARAPLVKAALNDPQIKDAFKLVYRHFPLDQHSYARAAAQAAEAANKQGKFWEYHDLLFENQLEWSESTDPKPFFTKYAENLKLDMDQFAVDFELQTVKDRIQTDVQSGFKYQVSSTPSFYLDGKKIDFTSLDELKKLLGVQ